MFLKSVTELNVDFADVRAAMLSEPRTWLAGLAAAAGADGEQLLVDVGLEVGGHEIGRRAKLEVRAPMTADRVVLLPLSLRVEDYRRLFPSLEGSLDAAWLGPGRTHLALTATYDPPLGVLGRVVDRALLHRVAEAVAQRFLEAIARELTIRRADSPDGHGPHGTGSRPTSPAP
jgi:hypothetical protein